MRNVVTFILLGLASCTTTTAGAGPSGSAATSAQPANGPSLAADGKHFAKDAAYQGSCAPPGSRGGCYSFLFHPNGSAENVLLDATDFGNYRIEGNAVLYLSRAPDSKEQRLESSDRFVTLGSYKYRP